MAAGCYAINMSKFEMNQLPKLKPGDKVAVLSPSFAAPAVWPHVYELGLRRLREVFQLQPIEYPTTRKLGATGAERATDLIAAFQDPEVKAVISTLGGDDQVTYVKNLPKEVFENNLKPFFGFSDCTHIANHLWRCGVPSYYGGTILTQFAMQGSMDDLTVKYLKHALFDDGIFELEASAEYNDIDLNWRDPNMLTQRRQYEPNDGWVWDGKQDAKGVTWGGCIESIDELMRHGIEMPSLEQFENVILIGETSEELPSAPYVARVFRALGERGILARVRGVLIGRPKAWEFDKTNSTEQKAEYRKNQLEAILSTVRMYNKDIPVVQNLDFGHTDPQICIPYGGEVIISSGGNRIEAKF